MATATVFIQQSSQNKKTMKRLTCRKCEGHGAYAILKGHAGACPHKDCACNTCVSVMQMRANALIRRFRHRQPDQNLAIVRTLRSKNGNMRLRIVPKSGQSEDSCDGALVTYTEDSKGHQTYKMEERPIVFPLKFEERSESIMSDHTNDSTPDDTPPRMSPVDFGADIKLENFQKLLTSGAIQFILNTYLSGNPMPIIDPSFLLAHFQTSTLA